MKKIIFLVIIIVLVIVFVILNNTDASKFKKEYESLNGEKNGSNVTRTITIDKNNPMVYSSASKIIKKMNNKETFVVYFGFAECPWCRSVLPTLIKVAKELKIDKIYYVDVLNIRDTLVVEDGKAVTKTKGTKDYYKLLKKLDNVLADYKLDVETNEKRIYAPNIVSVVNGKAKSLETGISDKQTDGYMKLTKDIKNDMYKKIKQTLKVVTDSGTCSLNKSC